MIMKRIVLSIALLAMLALPLVAQTTNHAVRWLSMDPSHEFNRVPGCPTNFPVAVDSIGTNTVSPWANRAVISEAALRAVYQAVGASFTNWYNGQYRPVIQAQADADRQSATNNTAALRSIFDDLLSYEQQWQGGSNATTTAQINTILRRHNAAFLRLRTFLQEKYQGE